MLSKNPATYFRFAQSAIPEAVFPAEVARRRGCGLPLDLDNVFVSCTDHSTDPRAWLVGLPLQLVGEVHPGGHDADEHPSGPLLIDSHGAAVTVW